MKTKEKVLISKGIDKVKLEKFLEAIQLFDRVLEINPESVDAWNNRGVALYRLGKTEEALDCYDRALKIDPGFLEAWRNKGFVLRSMERFESALECYDRVIAAEEDPSDLRYRASVLVGLGRLEEAMECLMEAASIEPSRVIEEEIAFLRMMINGSEKNEP